MIMSLPEEKYEPSRATLWLILKMLALAVSEIVQKDHFVMMKSVTAAVT